MNRVVKSIFKSIFLSISKLIIPIFYNKKYLKGKYFQESLRGWLWAWEGVLWQKILGFNRHIPWPVSFRTYVGGTYKNILFEPEDLHNFQRGGIYYQCYHGTIHIGRGSYIGPNVGVITSNHNPKDLDTHLESKDIIIGEGCWIGMNSVILPGVELGEKTIVGAGTVVTKSFPEGGIVIAGNPAKIIKKLN